MKNKESNYVFCRIYRSRNRFFLIGALVRNSRNRSSHKRRDFDASSGGFYDEGGGGFHDEGGGGFDGGGGDGGGADGGGAD